MTNSNVKIYAMIDGEYRLIHKQRVSVKNPVIDLSPPEIGSKSDEFMLVFEHAAVHKMKGKPVQIIGKDGAAREQSIAEARHFRINHHNKEVQNHDHQG